MRRLDIENPDRRRWSRHFIRHDYFAPIREPVQAYVAGLLAADGNVLARQRRLTLELSYRDRELVHLVRDQLAPGFPVRERTRPNGCRTVQLAITSAELFDGLMKLGITPRKSLTLEWPNSLDPVFARPFLLGYFDGDGFITWSRNGKHLYPRWGLLGTQSFLMDAMTVVTEETGIKPRTIHKSPTGEVHSFHVNGHDAWAVDEWIHANTELGLARKRLTQREAPRSRIIRT